MTTSEQLSSNLGRESWPLVFDIRSAPEVKKYPRFLPATTLAEPDEVLSLATPGQRCSYLLLGGTDSSAANLAGALQRAGLTAGYLEGGMEAWLAAGGPTVGAKAVALGQPGGSRWVTRARPKIDRVACPWLILRFLDPLAQFFYVPPDSVPEHASRLKATAFDIPDTEFSHAGPLCSFDAFLRVFGIEDPALHELAIVIRGADTARLELDEACAGLLAAALGLSALYADDQKVLETGLVIYDALYARIRFAGAETHNWPTPQPAGRAA